MYLRDRYELDLKLYYFTPLSNESHRIYLTKAISLNINTHLFADDYEYMAGFSHAPHYFDISIKYDKCNYLIGKMLTMYDLDVNTIHPYHLINSVYLSSAIQDILPTSCIAELNAYKDCYSTYDLQSYLNYNKTNDFPNGFLYCNCYSIGKYFATIECRRENEDNKHIYCCWVVLRNEHYRRIVSNYSEYNVSEIADVDDLENRCWEAILRESEKSDIERECLSFSIDIRKRNIEMLLNKI